MSNPTPPVGSNGITADYDGDVADNFVTNTDSTNGLAARAIAYVRDALNWACIEITGHGYNQQENISQFGFRQGGVGTMPDQMAVATNAVNGMRLTTEVPGAPILIGSGELNATRFDTKGVGLWCPSLGLTQTMPDQCDGDSGIALEPCTVEPTARASTTKTGLFYMNKAGSYCFISPAGNKYALTPPDPQPFVKTE